MSNKFKIFDINKIAQEVPPPPARFTGKRTNKPEAPKIESAPPATGPGRFGAPPGSQVGRVHPAPGHGSVDHWTGHGQGSSTVIMTMQHALQDLAQDVSQQINLQEAFSTDPRVRDEAKGRDAFGVFLTKNYMRNSQVPGVEFDPDPKKVEMKEKNPDDPTRLSVVMDTMNRIGTPKKGEQFVDGNWSGRTNAAIRDAFAFASGLLDFVDDINRFSSKKLNVRSYNRQMLQEFSSLISVENNLSYQQKIEEAPKVTQHVKGIQKLYDEVKNKILQHAAYRQFIEEDVPFKTYAKVTPDQIKLVEKQFPQGIPVKISGVDTVIHVNDLVNVDSLKKWMERAIPQLVKDNQITPEKIIDAIWQTQDQLLGSNPGY